MSTRGLGPGLAKTKPLPLISERDAVLVRTNDGAWRALLETADAVSEGQVRGGTWFGTTSLLLRPVDDDAPRLAAIAARCIHVRLRALRFARREAQARAPGALGPSQCQIRFRDQNGVVRIDIDVEAPMVRSRADETLTLR